MKMKNTILFIFDEKRFYQILKKRMHDVYLNKQAEEMAMCLHMNKYKRCLSYYLCEKN